MTETNRNFFFEKPTTQQNKVMLVNRKQTINEKSAQRDAYLRAGCSKAAQLLDVAKCPIPQG